MRTALSLLLLLAALSAGAAAADAKCLTRGCHPGVGFKEYPHAPVEEDCLACHVSVATPHPLVAKTEQSFKLSADGAALCEQCHEGFGKKKVIHPPVKDGECVACHRVHGAGFPHLLEVPAEDRSKLCFRCHDEGPFRQQFQHGPAAAGACVGCHDAHAAGETALLRRPVRELCLECHTDIAAQLAVGPVVHDPVQNALCTDCHDPHSSGVRYFLKKKMPDLCVGCHEKMGEKLGKVKVAHAPVGDARGCGNCHSPHVSKARALLPDDEMDVCLGCHGTDAVGNPPLKNIRKQLAPPKSPERAGKQQKQDAGRKLESARKILHGPLQKGSCAACHDPHGSANFRMLTGSYPAAVYVPYKEGTYGFCLECHEKYLLNFRDTTLYTGFRNGNQNLHVVHVADKRKGRTCRMCHEPHAAEEEKLISKQGFPFGSWNIPIRFQATPTGGSCSPGCHRPFAYDREKAVDYRKGDGS